MNQPDTEFNDLKQEVWIAGEGGIQDPYYSTRMSYGDFEQWLLAMLQEVRSRRKP